ncbi:MAG: alpha/beta hydrolase family protein [Mariniphaga sp.]
MKYLIIISLLFLMSCSGEFTGGRLVFHEANPEKGFNFPYYLFIPDGMDKSKERILIVEPNNSGFADDDFEKHREKAKRTAGIDFYTGNYVARKMNCPLLVPVFPRSKRTWKIYTHAFDRDLAQQKGNDLERTDLQLLAMTQDARQALAAEGYRLREQFLMTGFSASGTFVNRFTAVHPEKVLAAAAGGLNGLLILPVDRMDTVRLNFPLGVNNFPALFGRSFDSVAFKNTPQFLFMGELDDNDAIPYEDGYDDDERELIFNLLGQEMQPARWNRCKEIYMQNGINENIVTFPGIGHEQPEAVKEEIVEFFKKNLKN